MTDEQIVESVGMANLPKILYLLHEKHQGHVGFIDIAGDCMFRFDEFNAANVSYLAVYLHFITIKDRQFRIEGNVSWPMVYKDIFELKISVNGEVYPCSLWDAGMDVLPYESRGAFDFSCELDSEIESYDIKFLYLCNGIYAESGKINAMRFSPVSDEIPGQYAVRGEWVLQIQRNILHIENRKNVNLVQMEDTYRSTIREELSPEDFGKVIRLRTAYFKQLKRKRKPVWLCFDRLEKADDNGEAFFRYVNQRRISAAKCYFVLDKTSSDWDRLTAIGPVSEAFSDEHCVLLMLADHIFTSQVNGWVENPYGNLEKYFRDLQHQAKLIFLQHGVTKDDQTVSFNKFNIGAHAMISSSEAEKQAFLSYHYFYKEEEIWNTGMPRYDRLYDKKENVILFMPTWRKSLMEMRFVAEDGIYRWCLKDDFESSAYYLNYCGLLNDEKFLRQCREKGFRILFMPHPFIQRYIDRFRVSEEVQILPYSSAWRDLFAESALMVTDYSSTAFDFAYIKKPVIYFQFDAENFESEHSYRKGYFDYRENGFGPVVRSGQELVEEIIRTLDRNCEVQQMYAERVDTFFKYHDHDNAARIYGRASLELPSVFACRHLIQKLRGNSEKKTKRL